MDELEKAKPFIRLGIALIVYLRFGSVSVKKAYVTADEFLNNLDKDLTD